MFRALGTGSKVLEIFVSEKKFLESSLTPRGSIPLGYATCIRQHDPERRQYFSIEMSDGALCFFEAASINETEEWVHCLNAVLFGTGPHLGLSVCVGGGSYTLHVLQCTFQNVICSSELSEGAWMQNMWSLVLITTCTYPYCSAIPVPRLVNNPWDKARLASFPVVSRALEVRNTVASSPGLLAWRHVMWHAIPGLPLHFACWMKLEGLGMRLTSASQPSTFLKTSVFSLWFCSLHWSATCHVAALTSYSVLWCR